MSVTNAHQRSQLFMSAHPRRSSPSKTLDEAQPAPTNTIDRSRTRSNTTVDEPSATHHHDDYPPAPLDECRRHPITPSG
ncbi:hypothetical protein K443DRAFT_12515 [Laccaria amethystina LaAM-08-1]|uniref:Uncharacterized protein n=1 Tax=Laccaria amethystina LaAM-08-1 TaxID=1095629 RepID=A0A0C9X8J5_9AGAR|nr:hypothetical protein K443DRAFT_12515 [Laccaria amethystina LaAM-08-1]